MIKDLVAIVDDVDTSANFVRQSVGFAAAHEAHLTVTLLTRNFAMVAAAPYGGYPLAIEPFSIDQREDLEALARATAHAPCPIEIRGVVDAPAYLSGASRVEGRYADLLLVGAPSAYADPRLRRRLVETAVMTSGGPVLVLPEDAAPARLRHAVIGWDASGEARRATRDLTAMMEPGGRIDIVTVDAEESETGHGESPGASIARHLARHGFVVEVRRESSVGHRSVATVIEEVALATGADLLAIGAFAHSRVRDILLGGVTRALLDGARLPVMLSR